ncbi:MAG: hypothetical protein AAGI08_05890 [Bacteroidota bacterium]
MRSLLRATPVIFAVFLAGCTASRQDSAQDRPLVTADSLRVSAIESMGEGTACEPNVDGAYLLCINAPAATPLDPTPARDYAVYEVGTGDIAVKGSVTGEAVWEDAFHIRVTRTPGTVSAADPPLDFQLIDVRTGKRVSR